jgi:uncharacterized protein
MPSLLPSRKVYIDTSLIQDAGRGVFACQPIKSGEVIEICPVVELWDEAAALKNSELYNYYFLWKNKKNAAIALGFGSIYNHSYSPNATYKKHLPDKTIEFVAIKNIGKGEEITVNYNYGNPNDKTQLWIPSIKPPKRYF